MEIAHSIKEEEKNVKALAYFNLLKTSTSIELQIKKSLKKFDLTHAQLNVLSVLYNAKSAISLNELKSELIVHSPDISRLVDRLVRKELLKRETCPENRRKVNITLTIKGKKLFEKAHKEARMSVNNFFDDELSQSDAKTLIQLLRRIRNSIN